MSTSEEYVLMPRDMSIAVDENDWEEFGLTDVKIYAQGKSRFANLLDASEDHPVRVSGVLDELEEDQEDLLLDESYRSKRIHIDNVTHYAFGQHEDGEFGIWVAGQAGWYSITPAKQYQYIYYEIEEGIDLYYFLVDRCQDAKRRKKAKKTLSVDELFGEYVQHAPGRIQDAEDASEVFYNHRNFLLTHILMDTDRNGLKNSPIFDYLCEAYPVKSWRDDWFKKRPSWANWFIQDEYEEIRARLARKASMDGVQEEEDDEVNGEDHADDDKRQADTCFETLVNITESDVIPIRQLHITTLASILYERYHLSSIEYAEKLIQARSPLILELMDNVQPGGPNLTKRSIYRELQAAAMEGKESQEEGEVSHSPLRERSPPPAPDQSDTEVPVKRKGHHRKSVLRPPRYSSKAADRFGSRKRARPTESGSEAEAETGTVAADELDESPMLSRSHARSTPLVSRPRNISHLDHSNPKSVEASMEHQSPDLTPNGPGDTWMCKYSGCGHDVSRASTARGKSLIQDHMLTHANDSRAKIDLVLTEQRFHLPISNLVNHIQEMANLKSSDSPDCETSPASKRVKR